MANIFVRGRDNTKEEIVMIFGTSRSVAVIFSIFLIQPGFALVPIRYVRKRVIWIVW